MTWLMKGTWSSCLGTMKGQHSFRKDPPYSLQRSVMKQKMDLQTLVMLWKNSLHFFSPGGILQSSQLGLFQQHQALKMHFLTLGHPQSLLLFNFLLLAGKNPPSEDHTLSQIVISIQDTWMCEEIHAEQGKAAGMQGSVLGTHSLPATSCSF